MFLLVGGVGVEPCQTMIVPVIQQRDEMDEFPRAGERMAQRRTVMLNPVAAEAAPKEATGT